MTDTSNANHEPEEVLIAPIGYRFLMTRTITHLGLESNCSTGTGVTTALCGKQILVDINTTNISESEEVCPACLKRVKK